MKLGHYFIMSAFISESKQPLISKQLEDFMCSDIAGLVTDSLSFNDHRRLGTVILPITEQITLLHSNIEHLALMRNLRIRTVFPEFRDISPNLRKLDIALGIRGHGQENGENYKIDLPHVPNLIEFRIHTWYRHVFDFTASSCLKVLKIRDSMGDVDLSPLVNLESLTLDITHGHVLGLSKTKLKHLTITNCPHMLDVSSLPLTDVWINPVNIDKVLLPESATVHDLENRDLDVYTRRPMPTMPNMDRDPEPEQPDLHTMWCFLKDHAEFYNPSCDHGITIDIDSQVVQDLSIYTRNYPVVDLYLDNYPELQNLQIEGECKNIYISNMSLDVLDIKRISTRNVIDLTNIQVNTIRMYSHTLDWLDITEVDFYGIIHMTKQDVTFELSCDSERTIFHLTADMSDGEYLDSFSLGFGDRGPVCTLQIGEQTSG